MVREMLTQATQGAQAAHAAKDDVTPRSGLRVPPRAPAADALRGGHRMLSAFGSQRREPIVEHRQAVDLFLVAARVEREVAVRIQLRGEPCLFPQSSWSSTPKP
ncbi:hypothetical protein Srubr_38910 [Streptomyces rubradiris]|uniref:Uncharacterized protein n=1 Tax=Streptomyces rubradiris TaxID=285531 RepID=A0ABQ3RDZ8_STRRR|nr:hypothetical protein GCM10018792_71790 [Streptomyces rubradiris]GHI54045.1 hypothetical protein Srubr_38910 [Streptomyces rubradiris]